MPVGPTEVGYSRPVARVLIVDDDESVTEVLETILEGHLEFKVTNDAREAAAWLQENDFTGLVTDLNMPSLMGHELVELARKENPGVQVIFMSGETESNFEAELVSCRPYLFLTKPFLSLSRVRELILSFGRVL